MDLDWIWTWAWQYLFQERNFYTLTNSKYSKIEEAISAWLESINDEKFAEPILKKVLESITNQKPGILLLSKKNQETYHRQIKEHLEFKMKNGQIFNRKEMKEVLVRFLLKLSNPNSEFDILIFRKVKKYKQYLKQNIVNTRKHLLLFTLK